MYVSSLKVLIQHTVSASVLGVKHSKLVYNKQIEGCKTVISGKINNQENGSR